MSLFGTSTAHRLHVEVVASVTVSAPAARYPYMKPSQARDKPG